MFTAILDRKHNPEVFDEVNQALASVAQKVARKYGVKAPGRLHFGVAGNYTVCYILPSRGKNPVAFGVAKRNPKDEYDLLLGCRVALGRALKVYAETKQPYSLAV